jgi:serine protease Do
MGIRLLQLFAVVFVLVGASAFAQDRMVPRSEKELSFSFAPIVKKVSPAVVNIYTKRTVQKNVSPFSGDPVFERFFGNTMSGLTREQVESSLGSGVIVEPEGVIVTNAHVVKGA